MISAISFIVSSLFYYSTTYSTEHIYPLLYVTQKLMRSHARGSFSEGHLSFLCTSRLYYLFVSITPSVRTLSARIPLVDVWVEGWGGWGGSSGPF